MLKISHIYYKKKNVMKYPYRLVLICNGAQRESIGAYHTELQGIKAMNEISENSKKNTNFKVKYINNDCIEEAKYELVLIKKREKDDPLVNKLRNEYGEYVEHVSSTDKWLIIDKAEYCKEETFWIYGHHPITDRKDFSFIYNNLIGGDSLINLKLFLNKIIIEKEDTDIVLCKNKSDAIRLYNTLEEKILKNKKLKKRVFFYGDCNNKIARENTIQLLMNITNWNKQKICRAKTKTQKKKETKN